MEYLTRVRLQWGKPDQLAVLISALEPEPRADFYAQVVPLTDSGLPALPPGSIAYFTSTILPNLISIIQNDWPYSSK